MRAIVKPSPTGDADQGDHPVFGRLTPGRILDVPKGLWSDELFEPAPADASAGSGPPFPAKRRVARDAAGPEGQ